MSKIVKIKLKVMDLIAINNLVRVYTASSDDRIKKYIIEADKEEQALFVEIFQPDGKFAVCLRKEMEDIPEDILIPIEDSEYLNKILKLYNKNDVLRLYVNEKKVIIKSNHDIIKFPYFEEDDDEKQSRENVKIAFKTRKYGSINNILTFYGRANKEDPEPDATCKIDIKKLDIKKITSIFDMGAIEVGVIKNIFYLTIGGGKQKLSTSILRVITEGKTKDPTTISGKCSVLLQDISCFSLLASYSGFVNIDMKEDFPLVIKKEIEKHRIGVCYLMSLLEEMGETYY